MMKIKPIFAWYDLWVGVFIDTKKRAVYLFPVPMFGLKIHRSTGGPRKTVGQHSWRAMMRRIAEGELLVIDPATLPDYVQEMIAELAE